MKKTIRKSGLITLLILATLGIGSYFYFFYDPYDKTPDDPLYRDILSEFFAAQPIAVNVSPNGEYVLTKAELETGGFQIAVQDWKSSRVLYTNFSKNSQRSLTWRPDSQAIVFQEIDGMDRPLYLWEFESGKKKKLNVPVSQTALPPLRWNPCGKKLAYFHGDWRKGRLLVIDPAKNSSLLVIKGSMSGTCDFVWSPDGSAIALATASHRGVITIVRLDPLRSSEIEVGVDAKIESLAWSPDGKTILASARRDDDEHFKLFAVEPETSKVSLLAEASGDVGNPVWLKGGKSFVYHILVDGIIQAVLANQENARRTIGPTNSVLRVTHASPDGGRLYARLASLTKPPAWIEIPTEIGETKVVYAPPNSDEITCPQPRSIRIKSFDETMIPAYHWKSQEGTNPPAKVLIEVHGGLRTQTYPTWESYIQVMTKRGWDVIAVNYRGSSGFGRNYEEIGDDSERVLDVVAARDYAADILKTSPQNIFLMGNSNGSRLIAAAAAHGKEIGGVALISWAGSPPDSESNVTKPFRILAFQGALDPFVSPKASRNSIEKFFPLNEYHKKQWHTFKSEGHFFYLANSWATVCRRIQIEEDNAKR